MEGQGGIFGKYFVIVYSTNIRKKHTPNHVNDNAIRDDLEWHYH